METRPNIIIIDDERDLVSNLTDIMIEDYNVEYAFDGSSGISMCHEKAYDLAFIDIKLPDMLGNDIVTKLSEISPETECILITAYASLESAVEAVKQEKVAAYEIKPLNMDHILLLVREIFKRKMAEKAQRESEALYSALFKHNPIQTIVVNREGAIIELNRDNSIFSDKKPKIGDILYKDYLFSHETDMFSNLIECINSNTIFEFPEQIYDNKVLSIKMSSFDKGAIVTFQDITERKKLQEQLIHSEKLSAVGQLASGVAHEFNNLLSIIMGHTQLSIMETSIDEIRKSLYTIEKSANRGADLIKNLLSFIKPKKPELITTDVCNLIDEMLRLQTSQIKLENIQIEKNYSEHSVTSFDWVQLGQVFLNVFINSIHAIKPKGKGTISISVQDVVDYVEIKLNDDGIGMDEETRIKIFDPFFSTKGSYAKDDLGISGTGLGLSISYSIINQHNGIVSVESEKGKGTTFTILLPITTYGTNVDMDIESTEEDQHVPDIKDLRILLIDDEIEMTNVMSSVFDKIGIKDKAILNSGEEGLAIFFSFKPDIVFLDIVMPDLSGYHIFNKIREIDKKIPVVFMSGKIDLEKYRFIRDGAYDFIQKPFDVSEITKILNRFVKEKV